MVAVDAGYQNILRAGAQTFLLRAAPERGAAVHADVLDLATRRLLPVEVTALFHAFQRLAAEGGGRGAPGVKDSVGERPNHSNFRHQGDGQNSARI